MNLKTNCLVDQLTWTRLSFAPKMQFRHEANQYWLSFTQMLHQHKHASQLTQLARWKANFYVRRVKTDFFGKIRITCT